MLKKYNNLINWWVQWATTCWNCTHYLWYHYYLFCSQMNSSGLYLDASNNSSISSDHVPVDGRYVPLGSKNGRSLLSPLASAVRKSRHLQLPSNSGRAVSPTPSPSGELKPIYEAESPDELALVHACFQYNCKLLKRMPDSVTLSLPGETFLHGYFSRFPLYKWKISNIYLSYLLLGEGLIEFPVLHILPFDPTRKRMSVILLHPTTKEKILYCKGADSTIFTQLAPPPDEGFFLYFSFFLTCFVL